MGGEFEGQPGLEDLNLAETKEIQSPELAGKGWLEKTKNWFKENRGSIVGAGLGIGLAGACFTKLSMLASSLHADPQATASLFNMSSKFMMIGLGISIPAIANEIIMDKLEKQK